MSEFERAAATVRAEAARLHVRQQLCRFVVAFVSAAVPLAAAGGVHDWTWSAIGGVVSGAAVTAFRQWRKTVPVGAAIAALAAAAKTPTVEPPSTPAS